MSNCLCTTAATSFPLDQLVLVDAQEVAPLSLKCLNSFRDVPSSKCTLRRAAQSKFHRCSLWTNVVDVQKTQSCCRGKCIGLLGAFLAPAPVPYLLEGCLRGCGWQPNQLPRRKGEGTRGPPACLKSRKRPSSRTTRDNPRTGV